MLAKRLARHGLALSGGMLATALARTALASVPASVMCSTIKAVTLVAAGNAVTVSASAKVAVLTEGVLKTMLLTKLKLAAITVLLFAAFSCVAGLVYQTQAAASQEKSGNNEPANKKKAEEAAAKEMADDIALAKKLADDAAVKTAAEENLAAQLRLAEAQLEMAKANYEMAKANYMAAKDLKKVTDTQKLQGTWVVIETRSDGETRTVPEGVDARLTIEGDQFRLMFWSSSKLSNEASASLLFATFKLNTATSPRNIDLTTSNPKNPEANELCLGIYKFDGDNRLTICLAQERPGNHRPAEFKAEKGSNQMIYVLRRAKSEEKRSVAPKEPHKADTGKQSDAKKSVSDEDRLRGTWRITSVETDDVVDLSEATNEWAFNGTTATVTAKGEAGTTIRKIRFLLDEKSSPKRIDFVEGNFRISESYGFDKLLEPPQDRRKGIYAIEGDELILVINRTKGGRPNGTLGGLGANDIRLKFKRLTDEKNPPKKVDKIGNPVERVWELNNFGLGNRFWSDVRELKIPFHIMPNCRTNVKQLHLNVSMDEGKTWQRTVSVPRDADYFRFTASSDGLYLFAMQVEDLDGIFVNWNHLAPTAD